MAAVPPDDITPSSRSGATGGPATGLGVEYQTLYAVHVALDLLSRLLRETPLQRPQITIEPRVIGAAALTRWDLLVNPDRIAVEAKAKPTKGDLLEFLQRARLAASSTTDLRFELVYSECSIGFLAAIRKLERLGQECGDDIAKFEKLCEIETDPQLQEVLSSLGDLAAPVAQRLQVKSLPDHCLEDAIQFQLRYLVPSVQRAHLRSELTTRFLAGMKTRSVFFIAALKRELEARGVEFASPGAIVPGDLDPSLHRALFLLQYCGQGVPIEVLTAVSRGESIEQLRSKLERYEAAIPEETGLWRKNPLLPTIGHDEGANILAHRLAAILEFIKQNKRNSLGHAQVANAIDLVRECARQNPAAATTAFDPLDKLLKRRGQKKEVLEVATITVDCAQKVSRTEAVAKAEAKALICGHCWVYQRVGEFEKAKAFGEKSQQLGEDIGWPRNTAFCLKCLGRLQRVRAEQTANEETTRRLLNESADLLQRAIAAFEQCNEFGPADPEVGDCNSLLGRTQLLLGRLEAADESAARARSLIVDQSSKDYMDLLILEGELAARRLQYSVADARFTGALELLDPGDFEKSEIAARAYFARGSNCWTWKQTAKAAREDIEAAIRIWERANDHYHVGIGKWKLIEISEDVPRRAQVRLRSERPSVRVEAVRLLKAHSGKQSSTTLAQRSELSDDGWRQLLEDARRNDAIRNARW